MLRKLLKTARSRLSILAHGSGPDFAVFRSTGELQSAPIHPPWILEGDPRARARFFTSSADNEVKSGVWDCTAGQFRWIFDFDEVVQILEGEVHIEANGRLQILEAGDTAFFPLGLETRWTVPKYVRKFFSHRYPGRLVRALRGTRLISQGT